jgi:predicted acyl esterase
MTSKTEVLFRKGIPPTDSQYPGNRPGSIVDKNRGIVCEYDVAVAMRDGIKIYVNIFRPEKEGKYPVLIAWSPYGKHQPNQIKYKSFVGCGQSDADLSEYCIFEGPDAAYWCPYGYAIIVADPRGAWGSEGDLTFWTEQEALDCYDLIEWAGIQKWSNGKVGMNGVSYLAWIQWRVAALNPPHLAAINPIEGVSDFYRELAFHGGIPSVFPRVLFDWLMCFSGTRVEDIPEMTKKHTLFDDYWESKNADLSEIRVPAYVVASWPDHGVHNRGTLEGFKKISSKDKWLRVHGRKKWQDFCQNVERQRQFFDKFLKGIDSEVKYWPKVTLEVRERYFVGNFRNEDEWPLARTQYTKLFLNVVDRKLSKSPVKEKAHIAYDVETGNAQFEYEFEEKTELTGHMKLKLWVQADGSDDMDLFVLIDKIDRTGDRVPFPMQTMMDNGPAAYGWLRVSHRELDEQRSTPYQPFLKHQREIKLKPGEIVSVEIEIWPSSTLFERGEKLRLLVQGRDCDASLLWVKHPDTVNGGKHLIYTGGEYDSHLLVPVVPPK